ncbi:MAG: XTP/dITP diphosphatase [Halanaerobiales bacterium]
MKKLFIASTNQGKIKEIQDTYKSFNFEIVGLNEYPELQQIKEDGSSFEENALKKARAGANHTGLLTLADDSGLVVDYLDGKPGIYSARFAGENSSDEENNIKLLNDLYKVDWENRNAFFVCIMALVNPVTGEEHTVEGKCNGYIATNPRGDNGFGYDPIFYLPEYDKTMAELPPETKNKISHRAKALEKMKTIFKDHFFK